MNETPLILAGQDITECCKKIIPGQTDEELLINLQKLVPDHSVKLALIGDEWYRLGGIVNRDGVRLANDITEWVERTYLECGQNLQTLIEHSLENKLIATKQTGKTLYIVIKTGQKAENFTLVEIDKTIEVSDRLLVDENNPPEDLEEFIDPLLPHCVENTNFGHSRYTYRRKTDVNMFMEVLNERHPGKHPVQRFMDDWNRSSASSNASLCDDWIIRPYRHTGRYGEQCVNAEIININKNNLPHLENIAGVKGTSLSHLLNRFDRQAGYAFAWFFYMLKGKQVVPYCAEGVYQDITNDFAYLPERDMVVVKDWVNDPYNV